MDAQVGGVVKESDIYVLPRIPSFNGYRSVWFWYDGWHDSHICGGAIDPELSELGPPIYAKTCC